MTTITTSHAWLLKEGQGMTDREFWQAVYIAAIRRGCGSATAATLADEAVAQNQQR